VNSFSEDGASVLLATEFCHEVGSAAGGEWRAEPGATGFVCFGPYARCVAGIYRLAWRIRIGASVGADELGFVDVCRGGGRYVLCRHVLEGGGAAGPRLLRLEIALAQTRVYEFRLFSSGRTEVVFESLTVERLGPVPAQAEPAPGVRRVAREPFVGVAQVSFPRSGTHWLRRVLAELLGLETFDVQYVPELEGAEVQPGDVEAYRGVPWLQWHVRLESARLFPERAVLYQVRDLRDGIASWYVFWSTRPPELARQMAEHLSRVAGTTSAAEREAFVERFQRLSKGEAIAELIDRYAVLHRANARELRDRPDIAVVRYRDLLRAGDVTIQRLLRALGYEASDMAIRAALERHDFERVTGRRRGEEDPSAHARKGVEGDWVNHLAPGHIAAIEGALADVPPDLWRS